MRQASQLTPLDTKRTRRGEERGRTTGHDHEAGAGRLEDAVRPDELEEGVDALRLARHLDNDALVADVDELAAELLGEEAQAAQVRVLHAQRLGRRQALRLLVDVDARVDLARRAVRVVDVLLDGRALLGALGRGEDVGALVGELVLEVLGPEDRDLGEEELALDRAGAGVVEDGPDGDLQAGEGGSSRCRKRARKGRGRGTHKVLELPPRLLNDAVLATQDDAHARQVLDLSGAHDERVDVEAAGGEDAGHARQDTGLVLDEAVEGVAGEGLEGGRRSCVRSCWSSAHGTLAQRAR